MAKRKETWDESVQRITRRLDSIIDRMVRLGRGR